MDIQKHYVPASAVFIGVMQYLKDDLLQQLQNRGYHHDLSNIQFVVTVPAIWSDAAKQAMTEYSVKVARYLSFYLKDFVKFIFILQENIPAKENNRKIKGRIIHVLILLNKPVKHVYPYIHWKQSFRSFTIDNIFS
jgi:hypothetical protein